MSVEISITDQIVEINEVSNPVEISVTAGAAVAPVWGNITGTLSNQTDLQNALNAKVPYSGATANVDLGEFELKAGQIEFDQTPTGVASAGVMRWNDTTGVSETTLKGGSVLLRNGVDLVARVVNKVTPNTTLTKAAYQAVRVSGAQGQRLAVAFAQANNDANSADTIGLVTETIATNQEGFIMAVGQLENINTTGSLQGETWADGDVLYLSPTTAGRITNIKPVAPNHIIVIGYVEYAHVNNGKIYVKVMNGWELGELHDVNTTGAVAGNVLKYNGTIWTPSGDVGITSLNGLTGTTQTFSVDDRGTDVNIDSSASNHKFNFPSASAVYRGVLTSADWTTFNNKQNALTNPVTGTGVAGQVAYWSGTNTQVGSNNLFWDATNSRLGVGTNVPTIKLSVVDTTATNVASFRGSNNSIIIIGDNTLAGESSLQVVNSQAQGFFGVTGTIVGVTGTSGATVLRFNLGGSERARITSNGNLHLGTFVSDAGQRLQVTGDTLLKGSGNTSATTALTVQNSDGTNMLRTLNNGAIAIGSSADRPLIFPFTTSAGSATLSGTNLSFFSGTSTQAATQGIFAFENTAAAQTSGNNYFIRGLGNYIPTSGTGTYAYLRLEGTINQTGGANGITRGLFIAPTLTAAADWRSIEWSNNTGWGLRGEGTAPNYLGGVLHIGTTNPSQGLRIGTAPTLATSSTLSVNVAIPNSVTTAYRGILTSIGLNSSGFTLPNLSHFEAVNDGTHTAGVVTNLYGFRENLGTYSATNVFGFYGNIASGTGRWNLYMNGTAANYMAGSLGIGATTNLTSRNLSIVKNTTGSLTAYSVVNDSQVQSDVTANATGFYN